MQISQTPENLKGQRTLVCTRTPSILPRNFQGGINNELDGVMLSAQAKNGDWFTVLLDGRVCKEISTITNPA